MYRIVVCFAVLCLAVSCKKEKKAEQPEKEIEETVKTQVKQTSDKPVDFFEILTKELQPTLNLVSVMARDFDKSIDNFEDDFKEGLRIQREARYSNSKNKALVYVKEYRCKSPDFLKHIKRVLRKGTYTETLDFDGESHDLVMPYIKAPHTYFGRDEQTLYLAYVKATYNQEFINEVEAVFESSMKE